MKRRNSSDSLGALVSICPNSTDEHHVNNQEDINTMYTRDHLHEFHHHHHRDNQTHVMDTLLVEEGCVEESGGSGHVSEKKRRLSNEQVKALEKNFEVENKLEPERKVKLAQELGLQPRQVAVWFQNRRARWKSKNLERDYGVLKANYDALKLEFENLQRDNESLLSEIQEIKSKLNGDGSNKSSSDSQVSVKEEPFVSETDDDDDDNEKGNLELVEAHVNKSHDQPAMKINFDENSNKNPSFNVSLYDSKDGSSDSDSSAILNNEDHNNNNYIFNNYSNSPTFDDHHDKFLKEIHHNYGSSSMNLIGYSKNSNASNDDQLKSTLEESKRAYQPQFVKIEEHNFFNEEDSCTTATFFSDEQAPTLNWYNPEEWNH